MILAAKFLFCLLGAFMTFQTFSGHPESEIQDHTNWLKIWYKKGKPHKYFVKTSDYQSFLDENIGGSDPEAAINKQSMPRLSLLLFSPARDHTLLMRDPHTGNDIPQLHDTAKNQLILFHSEGMTLKVMPHKLAELKADLSSLKKGILEQVGSTPYLMFTWRNTSLFGNNDLFSNVHQTITGHPRQYIASKTSMNQSFETVGESSLEVTDTKSISPSFLKGTTVAPTLLLAKKVPGICKQWCKNPGETLSLVTVLLSEHSLLPSGRAIRTKGSDFRKLKRCKSNKSESSGIAGFCKLKARLAKACCCSCCSTQTNSDSEEADQTTTADKPCQSLTKDHLGKQLFPQGFRG